MYGSADPVPYQNVTDPTNWYTGALSFSPLRISLRGRLLTYHDPLSWDASLHLLVNDPVYQDCRLQTYANIKKNILPKFFTKYKLFLKNQLKRVIEFLSEILKSMLKCFSVQAWRLHLVNE
jgi:hypothetical protein